MRTLRLAAAALLLPSLAALAAALFLARPDFFLTDRTVGAALKRFGHSYAPHWSSLRFDASAIASRRHRYALKARNVCLISADGAIHGCFSRLELSAVVHYGRKGPRIEILENLIAESDALSIDLRRAARPAAPPPAALFTTPVRELRVDLSSFTFANSTAAVSGAFKAVLAPSGRRPLFVAADLRIGGPAGARRLKGELTADTDILKGGTATYIDLIGQVDFGSRGRARAAFRVRREASRFAGSGSAEFAANGGPLRAFRLGACRATAPLRPGDARLSSVEMSCGWEAVPNKLTAGPLGDVKAVKGKVILTASRDGEKYLTALRAELDPIAAWYELAGDLRVSASGRFGRPWKDAAVSHEVRASVKVAHFEELVAFLRDTKYSVPAPVHVLKGPLALALESRGDPRSARPVVRYAFTSDLAGPRQRLILSAAGDLTVVNPAGPGRSFEHAGELILKEVALELPRLDLERAPKILIDKRIKTIEDEPAAAAAMALPPASGVRLPPLRGSLAVKTAKPLILFSNLTKDPVPAELDLLLTFPPAAAAGRIAVKSFGVELFRRTATVDHLNVALTPGLRAGALEGLIRYTTPSASIGIVILGTTEKPRIELTSVPPMKREEIIALLIFGKSPDELDPEQTASVSNTETALESRAFGLASLYLFGATPIEHVGYDSASKTTSVRLRLPGGANLTLGSDFDLNRQLTVRKPLAPHWAIQSEFTDQGRQSKVATTFLEWFNRY